VTGSAGDSTAGQLCEVAPYAIEIGVEARKLLLADVGEPRQYASVDCLLVLKDADGMVREAPFLVLQEGDGGVTSLLVVTESEDEERPRHPVHTAVDGIYSLGVMFRIVPLESDSMLRDHGRHGATEVLHEGRADPLS